MEPVECDEAFFRYDGGTMVKVEGYYIYYEKNSQMQTYMIERNQNVGPETSEKVEDKAVRNFRRRKRLPFFLMQQRCVWLWQCWQPEWHFFRTGRKVPGFRRMWQPLPQ